MSPVKDEYESLGACGVIDELNSMVEDEKANQIGNCMAEESEATEIAATMGNNKILSQQFEKSDHDNMFDENTNPENGFGDNVDQECTESEKINGEREVEDIERRLRFEMESMRNDKIVDETLLDESFEMENNDKIVTQEDDVDARLQRELESMNQENLESDPEVLPKNEVEDDHFEWPDPTDDVNLPIKNEEDVKLPFKKEDIKLETGIKTEKKFKRKKKIRKKKKVLKKDVKIELYKIDKYLRIDNGGTFHATDEDLNEKDALSSHESDEEPTELTDKSIFLCHLCDCTFDEKPDIKNHIRSLHPKMDPPAFSTKTIKVAVPRPKPTRINEKRKSKPQISSLDEDIFYDPMDQIVGPPTPDSEPQEELYSPHKKYGVMKRRKQMKPKKVRLTNGDKTGLDDDDDDSPRISPRKKRGRPRKADRATLLDMDDPFLDDFEEPKPKFIKEENFQEEETNFDDDDFFEPNFDDDGMGMKKESGEPVLKKVKETYKCEQCPKTFIQSSSLIRHKATHLEERTFMCDICSKTFSQSGSLKRHKMIHSDEKKFKCETCAKSFSQADSLSRHRLIHTEEKKYMCEICSKTFSQSGSLSRHKQTNCAEKQDKGLLGPKTSPGDPTNPKPVKEKLFKCDQCNKSFSQSGSLSRHKLMHSNDKTFKGEQLYPKIFSQLGAFGNNMAIKNEPSSSPRSNQSNQNEERFTGDLYDRYRNFSPVGSWTGNKQAHREEKTVPHPGFPNHKNNHEEDRQLKREPNVFSQPGHFNKEKQHKDNNYVKHEHNTSTILHQPMFPIHTARNHANIPPTHKTFPNESNTCHSARSTPEIPHSTHPMFLPQPPQCSSYTPPDPSHSPHPMNLTHPSQCASPIPAEVPPHSAHQMFFNHPMFLNQTNQSPSNTPPNVTNPPHPMSFLNPFQYFQH